MDEMSNLDYKIKRSLNDKVELLEPSEETFRHILNGIEDYRGRKTLNLGFKQYITAIMCAVVIISGAFMFSDNTRAFAMDTLAAIKTIFIIDENHNVIEKPTTYSFLQPAFNKNTQSSDSDLSKQMGINISFPEGFYKDFTLQWKAEAVGFTKNMDYETFRSLQNTAVQAFDNNEIFKGLEKYQPYRSVGAVYSNEQGDQIGAVIYNKKVSYHIENINITDTVQTKVGNQNAEWVSLKYPVYPQNDLTQKPINVLSTSMLFWSTGSNTYQIWPMNNKSLSMAETVKFAESFLATQAW